MYENPFFLAFYESLQRKKRLFDLYLNCNRTDRVMKQSKSLFLKMIMRRIGILKDILHFKFSRPLFLHCSSQSIFGVEGNIIHAEGSTFIFCNCVIISLDIKPHV